MWMWHDGSWWWWLSMGAGMVTSWGAIAAVVVVLLRRSEPGGSPATPGARQVLAERYARGEIDDAEYHRRLDTLDAAAPRTRAERATPP